MPPYAKRFSEAAWDEHRDFIRLKYLVDEKTLKEVRDELEQQRGFSVRQVFSRYECLLITDTQRGQLVPA